MPVTLPFLVTDAINPFALLLVMMVVVFLILGLLVLLVSLVGRIFIAADRKKATAPAKTAPTSPAKPAPAKAPQTSLAKPAPVVEDGIEEETAAVIMAAVAAYESANGTNGVVRSISTAASSFGANAPARRTRSAWAEAGIRQNLNPMN